ncbi:MAG: site-2 protease family protein, partial [Acidobacteria bacterium]|nr:site-2 protease family protein [Acidobacteriota bacterium]
MSDTPQIQSATYDYYRPTPVYVVQPPKRRYWLHILLLLGTLFTTMVVGARMQYNFNHGLPAFTLDSLGSLFPVRWVLERPSRFLLGLPFSLTLLFILLCHELGHFVYCVRNRVYATLPFFIPAPTLIGTLGAFIRIRSPIRSRKALFDIGIAGPIAGFVVGVVALAVSMFRSRVVPGIADASDVQLGLPLIFHVLHRILPLPEAAGGSSSLRDIAFHPAAVAAWIGMFATALNLIPGGQLDGGHIVAAVAPGLHRRFSRIMVFVLLVLAGFWAGWLLWSVLLMATGMRHPMVAREPGLGTGRQLLAAFAVIMLLLTFV